MSIDCKGSRKFDFKNDQDVKFNMLNCGTATLAKIPELRNSNYQVVIEFTNTHHLDTQFGYLMLEAKSLNSVYMIVISVWKYAWCAFAVVFVLRNKMILMDTIHPND